MNSLNDVMHKKIQFQITYFKELNSFKTFVAVRLTSKNNRVKSEKVTNMPCTIGFDLELGGHLTSNEAPRTQGRFQNAATSCASDHIRFTSIVHSGQTPKKQW